MIQFLACRSTNLFLVGDKYIYKDYDHHIMKLYFSTVLGLSSHIGLTEEEKADEDRKGIGWAGLSG